MTDAELMEIAEHQIDWIMERRKGSRSAGRLALLSVLMELVIQVRKELPVVSRLPEVLALPRYLAVVPISQRVKMEEVVRVADIKALADGPSLEA